MSKRKHKKQGNKVKTCVTCFDCANCMYIGEGDHICDVDMTLVVDEWDPTDEFYHCGGKEFIQI